MSEKPQEVPREALPKLWQQMRYCPFNNHLTPYQTCPIHSVPTLPIRVYVEPK